MLTNRLAVATLFFKLKKIEFKLSLYLNHTYFQKEINAERPRIDNSPYMKHYSDLKQKNQKTSF